MGLDVYFRRDAANFLRATAMAMEGGVGLSIDILDGLGTEEQARLIAAFKRGAYCALVSVGTSFGLQETSASVKNQNELEPPLAGLLWAESPQIR